ncbi:MAG: Isopropylmalate/homocitrate/citramalate synthase [Massilibacillus sp.]|jgi:2-isopropylmalate synthase|nr:Isopropylmalate/homocitrate/citramalate synthase [Massilibacillus sp.]
MKNFEKYTRGYFMPPVVDMSWTQKEYVDKAPMWCSVDLRDGNQALIIPMNLEEKIEFFKFLVKIGFKEIEVGFPAASETEYEFVRKLIEENLIPDDVTIQVLTQSREHIIKKTFEALKGAKQAVVHLYNSTSVAQREQVFRKSKEEVIAIAEFGAKLLNQYAKEYPGNFRFEYSPESFTGTELEFALEICNRVLDIWQPTETNKVIINLPATVSMSMPHIYAAQIAYMSSNMKYRKNVILSLHPHNDRGCAVADSEMGLLAGADRIEGTLFGNGERTGNADIVTIAMNMFAHGVNPELDFSNMPEIISVYERMTRMTVGARQPYAGELVFAAFSGSHQDAIAKGMKWREEKACDDWTVPYLPIDPKDVGREYDGDVIRINSQSGKGGIGYIMEQKYGLVMPAKLREDFGYAVKNVSDHNHKELMPDEIYEIFQKDYVNIETPINVTDYNFVRKNGIFEVTANFVVNGEEKVFIATGNGRLDAISSVLQDELGIKYTNLTYSEHALEQGSKSRAAAYISVTGEDGKVVWGAGIDNDIITASVNALISAVNKKK